MIIGSRSRQDIDVAVTVDIARVDRMISFHSQQLATVFESSSAIVDPHAVAVNEDQTAINGVFAAHPNDDAVTLTASVGQINEGGRLNGALNFDGGNDYAEAPSDPAFDTINYTAEAWVKPDGSGASYKWIMGRRTSGSGWNVYISPAGNFQLWNGWSIPIQGPQASFGEWTHVAVTGDASGQKLFINGQLAGSTGAVVNPAVNQTFILGANNDGKQWKFGGLMDDVRFWNVTRSETDIQNSMESELNGNEAGLVAYYKLNDGPGNSTYSDSTGNGHTGTLINTDPATSWSSPGWSFNATDGPVESQPVTITATDSNGESAQTTFTLVVNNVAPNFEAGGNETLLPPVAGAFSRSLNFTDPGADVWSGTVNWGDGSESLLINQASKSFNLNHVYTADGTYTVSVTVNDGDG